MKRSQVTFNKPTDPEGYADSMMEFIRASVVGQDVQDEKGTKLGKVVSGKRENGCIYILWC
jgi:hypothetical protein